MNEMTGNGTSVEDAGTLIVVSGALVAPEPSAASLAIAALGSVRALARLRRRQEPLRLAYEHVRRIA